jgi:DNA-binding CsgD family transcriptional regulator
MWHVEESSLMLTAFSDVLETSARGVLLLDRAGRVVFANPAARVLAQAGDSFVLRRERIEALNGQEDAALQRLIGAATRRMGAADAARSGVMRLSRRSGRAELALVAAPLASATSLVDAGPVAFLLITDPQTTATRPESLLRQLFGLSAAEARVAERLMLGESPEQAAASLGIKISTARWHLASLYRKTGTRSQAQLMRQLLSVPTL